jgi:hypothetical protein
MNKLACPNLIDYICMLMRYHMHLHEKSMYLPFRETNLMIYELINHRQGNGYRELRING